MSLFGSILKTGLDLITTPIEVVKDVATMGGAANGQDESYIERRLQKLARDIEDIEEDVEDL